VSTTNVKVAFREVDRLYHELRATAGMGIELRLGVREPHSSTMRVERIFGYAAAEVVGQNIKMLLPENSHGEHDDYLEHCRTTGEASVIGVRREVLGRR
jgi:hypothetical protein